MIPMIRRCIAPLARTAANTAAILVLLVSLLPISPPALGQQRSNHKEAVKNLKAYAAYKSGQYDTARRMWEELAEKGNTTALVNLANLFQQGQGVTEDQKRAMGYVQKAAELGDARAQFELGIAHEKGTVVDRNIEKQPPGYENPPSRITPMVSSPMASCWRPATARGSTKPAPRNALKLWSG